MVIRTLWLWLSVCWLLTWLTEAFIQPSGSSICDLGYCRCHRGRLLCDCSSSNVQDIVLRDLEYGSLSSISVANCANLHIQGNALSGLPGLQQVSIANVSTVSLEERSFSFPHSGDSPQLLVNISHCHLPEIPSYCFRGFLREVLLSEVRVSLVRPYAFSSLDHLDNMAFQSVQLELMEPQAFKKFAVERFSVKDSTFSTLPTRSMVDVEVHQEVILDNVTIDTIKHSGMKMHGCKHFRLSRSTIKHIERQAFHVHTRGSVSILDNVFLNVEKSAFVGLTVERRFLQEFGKQELKFENNTLVDFERAPLTLNTSGLSPRMDWIVIRQQCSCQSADLWTSDLVYFSSDPRAAIPAPQVGTVLYCLNSANLINVGDYQRLFCKVPQTGILMTLAVTTATIVAISVLLIFLYCGFKERARRYMNVPNSPSPFKNKKKNNVLVIPDAKTYRETELHVIVEHVEPFVPVQFVSATEAQDVKPQA